MDGSAAAMRLRRLPHVFGKVLELPFRSDDDVIVEENAERFRFVAEIGGDAEHGGGLRAHAVEIHPGITKIVVRNNSCHQEGSSVALFLEQMMLDTWRFRLPAFTQPELTRAAFVDGKLIVTVPKGGSGGGGRGELANGRHAWGWGGNRTIRVQ
nr:nodulin 22 [Ipomoea batatas]